MEVIDRHDRHAFKEEQSNAATQQVVLDTFVLEFQSKRAEVEEHLPKRKKGKGSSAKTNDCNQNSALLPSEPWVEILSTDGKEDFSESVSYGSSIIISTDDRTIEDLHVKVKSRMGGQVVQEFFFDTTKMCTGDIFGILSVSGIKFK